MNLQLDVGSNTNVGKVREHNEDYFTTTRFPGGDLLVVCDGMGGHAAGDVASKVAGGAIVANILPMRLPDPREAIFRAAIRAHEEVLQVAEASPDKQGMGTTCVVAWIREGQMFVGNVGDSRAYLVRGAEVRMVSVDQTKVQAMVEKGILTLDEAKKHPDAGVLSQAIGQKNKVNPYVDPEPTGIPLEAGDVVLLCSDGVYDCMDDATIARLAASGDAETTARTLVEYAVTNDGKDNATAVVARVVVADGQTVSATVPEGFPVSQGSATSGSMGVGRLGSSGVAPTLVDLAGHGDMVAKFPSASSNRPSPEASAASEQTSGASGLQTSNGSAWVGRHRRAVEVVGGIALLGLGLGAGALIVNMQCPSKVTPSAPSASPAQSDGPTPRPGLPSAAPQKEESQRVASAQAYCMLKAYYGEKVPKADDLKKADKDPSTSNAPCLRAAAKAAVSKSLAAGTPWGEPADARAWLNGPDVLKSCSSAKECEVALNPEHKQRFQTCISALPRQPDED